MRAILVCLLLLLSVLLTKGVKITLSGSGLRHMVNGQNDGDNNLAEGGDKTSSNSILYWSLNNPDETTTQPPADGKDNHLADSDADEEVKASPDQDDDEETSKKHHDKHDDKKQHDEDDDDKKPEIKKKVDSKRRQIVLNLTLKIRNNNNNNNNVGVKPENEVNPKHKHGSRDKKILGRQAPLSGEDNMLTGDEGDSTAPAPNTTTTAEEPTTTTTTTTTTEPTTTTPDPDAVLMMQLEDIISRVQQYLKSKKENGSDFKGADAVVVEDKDPAKKLEKVVAGAEFLLKPSPKR